MFKKIVPFLLVIFLVFPLLAQEEKEKKAEKILQAIEDNKDETTTSEEATKEVVGEAEKKESEEMQNASETEANAKVEGGDELEASPEKAPEVLPIKKEKKKDMGPKEAVLLAPAIHGQTGLFRVYSAQRQKSSLASISMSMHGEYFNEKNFLNVGDEISAWRWSVAMTYAPIKYVEIFASMFGVTNTGKTNTSLIQRMGDLRTGVKLGYDLGFISLGTNFIAEILNGAGDVNLAENSYNYDLRALATADFLKGYNIPIRLHLNVGYRWDGTINAAGALALGPNPRFFLDIMPRDQMTFGVGFEVPIEFVSLFVEYTFNKVKSFSFTNSPQKITTGFKLFPTKAQTVSFDFGADIGLANSNLTTRAIGVPTYNLIFGMTIIHLGRVKKEVKVVPKTGYLSGAVMDPDTSSGVAGAVINFDDGQNNSIIAKDDGTYKTYDLTPGEHALTVTKEGYEPLKIAPTVVAGETQTVDLVINKIKLQKGAVIFQIYDADDKPLIGSVAFMDYPKLKPYDVNTSKGGLKVKLKEGSYKVKITAAKFQPEEKVVKIAGGKEDIDKTTLRELEAKVEIQKDKVIIKDKIHFASGKAEIKTNSLSLLNRVADLIADNSERIKKLRIEGYTDSIGAADFNLKLSQKRAEAVKEYLVIRGIEDTRLEAVGYGEVNPIAPNSSPQGRAINRRVEFTILGQ